VTFNIIATLQGHFTKSRVSCALLRIITGLEQKVLSFFLGMSLWAVAVQYSRSVHPSTFYVLVDVSNELFETLS